MTASRLLRRYKMGKLKTKKTLSKRVRITKNGKVIRKQIGIGHLKIKHDASRKGRKHLLNTTGKAHTILFRRFLGKKYDKS